MANYSEKAPPRPSILSLEPSTLADAGTATVHILYIKAIDCLPDVGVFVDGVSVPTLIVVPLDGVKPANIQAQVDMSAMPLGVHIVTLTDSNGASWSGVQVNAVRPPVDAINAP